MLTLFRRFAKSWVATIIIGLIAISFVVVGTQTDVLAGSSGTAVIDVGDRDVTPDEFKRLFDNVRKQSEQEAQRPVSVDDAVREGLHNRLLEDLALQESFSELLGRMGLRPADRLIGDLISKTPIFFNQVSGAFDRDAYQQQLAQNGLTEAQFEGFLRDDVAQRHYVAGVGAGMMAPRIYGALGAVYNGETRSITYFVVDTRLAGVPSPPSDAQLTAFLRENSAALRRPESRVISVVRFSAAEAAPTVTIDPAEVQRQYDFRKDSLSEPERRSFVQISAPDQATATQIATRLRAGEAPDAVARAFKVEPVRYQAQPRTAVVDRKAAEAAFALPVGGVSAPVRGDLNWAVVKVDAIAPGTVVTLEQARPAIEAELRKDASADAVLDQVTKFEEATSGGQTLAEAAKALGRPVISLPPITARGTDVNNNPTGVPQPLVTAAFDLPVGGESDVIDAGQNEFFVVRVDRVNAAAVPPLAEIRGPLAQAWMLDQTNKRLQQRADALAAQIRGGARGAGAQPLETVATAAGATIGRALQFKRDAGGQTLSRDIVAKAFAAKRGEIVVGQHTQLGLVVARIDGANPPILAEAAQTTETQRPAVTVDIFQSLGDMARTAARTQLKARVYADRARTALGLDPEAAAPGGAAPPTPS